MKYCRLQRQLLSAASRDIPQDKGDARRQIFQEYRYQQAERATTILTTLSLPDGNDI
jgi:hypothetical protein